MTGLEGDVHIAGVLVQCRPLQLLQVQRAVAAIEGADVDRTGADGKLVVVIEAASSRAVLDAVDGMRALPGVLDVALVYQHAEPAAAMNQEMEP
jgi:nitrate reductase NapD